MLFNKHYPCLDFLRATAITLVLLVHFSSMFYPLPQDTFFVHFLLWGWNGVGLFFALSGFLIGGQIIEALQRDSFSFKKFYIKRFWRIFPPYYCSLLIVAILMYVGWAMPIGDTQATIKTFVYHIFYLQNYLHIPQVRLALYWSLAVEEQFYIVAPLLLYILWRYCRPYFARIITALILLGISMRFIFYGPNIDWLMYVRWPFHMRFDSLLFGVLAAYVFITYNERLRRLSVLTKGLFFLSAFAAIGTALIFGKDTSSYFNSTWQFTLTGFGFAMLTLSIAISSFDSYIHVYLKRFFALVAKLSYTMYLYHLLLIFPVGFVVIRVHKLFRHRPDPIGFMFSFCLYFLVVLLVSAVIYHFVDKPAMSYRKRILKRMAARER